MKNNHDRNAPVSTRTQLAQVFYLAAAAVTATPTANNVVIMCGLYGNGASDSAAMAAASSWEEQIPPLGILLG